MGDRGRAGRAAADRGGRGLPYRAGGFELAGWVGVATCLGAAAVAARLPEPPRTTGVDRAAGWWPTLRAGVAEATGRPVVRAAVLLVVAVGGLDAVEESV